MTFDRDRLRAASATLFRNGLHDLADAVDAAAEEAVRLRDAVDRVAALRAPDPTTDDPYTEGWDKGYAVALADVRAALTDALGEGERPTVTTPFVPGSALDEAARYAAEELANVDPRDMPKWAPPLGEQDTRRRGGPR